MSNPFASLLSLKRESKTYAIGLLQAKAYRILNAHTAKILKQYDISPIHWAFLGLLYESPKGLRVGDIASLLGVEKPFITSMVGDIDRFISVKSHAKDKRVKIIILNHAGSTFVANTEKIVRRETKPLLEGVSLKDLLGYSKVLHAIIKNSSPKNK